MNQISQALSAPKPFRFAYRSVSPVALDETAAFELRFFRAARRLGTFKDRAAMGQQLQGLLIDLFYARKFALVIVRGGRRRHEPADVFSDPGRLLSLLPAQQRDAMVNRWLARRESFALHVATDRVREECVVAGVALGGACYALLFALSPEPQDPADPAFIDCVDLVLPHIALACRKILQREHRAPSASPERGDSAVSRREREVLMHVCRGYSDQEIAQQIGRSIHTVRDHVKSLLRKLGVSNRIEAAHVAAEFSMLAEVRDSSR